MGRELKVDVPRGPGPSVGDESDPQEILLRRALAGEAEAAHWLVTLLQSECYRDITGKMGYLKTGAHTATIDDVFQDTLIRFMERLKSGELKDLAPEDRKDIQQYFQRLCDGRLRDALHARKSPLLARHKEEVPLDLVDKNARIPGDARQTEHLALVHSAISRLDPEHATILRRVLAGMPYEEIATETGRTIPAIKCLMQRIKEDLQADIAPRSATARLKYEEEKAKERQWPSRSVIEAAIAVLPPEIKEAAVFLHVERRSLDEFARKLGDRGYEKAQARLKQAYRSLSGRMKVPFPEAFEKSQP
ncbi:MAG TPA: sigma-70 family RNA polymerase sigma factor [Planctomycetota bacterium]|nr:sigma-70 family RNA polymerase sigma factor [Planctomycetota bacterium]